MQVVLYESEVINEWLEEQFPLHPPLLPQDPLARSQVIASQVRSISEASSCGRL
jgi:glutathione S-transferase